MESVMLRFFLLLLFPMLASAQTVGLHLVSGHEHGGLNNINPGVYVRFDNGVTFGAYRNSYKRVSTYLGYTAEVFADRVSLGVTVGAITGYQRISGPQFCPKGNHEAPGFPCFHEGKRVQVMFVPSIAYHAGDYAVRLGIIPRAKEFADAHLMIERHF
jgi:hypothetical protein